MKKKKPNSGITSYNLIKKSKFESKSGNKKDSSGVVTGINEDGKKFTIDTSKQKRDALTGKYISKTDAIKKAEEMAEKAKKEFEKPTKTKKVYLNSLSFV